ncbi:MAG: SAM-dependent methyltransferase [Gammaproteobacteria bacterium]|nr:SAM-dependent methyltransferase [Gammaproteobacteria bacterium]
MNAKTELPEPGPDAIAHSAELGRLIRARIRAADGWLDFSEYMQLALYAPGLGYYSGGATKFGESGDFVTAPEVSSLFSRSIARAVAPVSGAGKQILEFGAGTGTMAAGILETLSRDHALPDRYLILEVSADLCDRQRRTLGERVPDLVPLVVWLDELPPPFDGVVLANEVIDALAASRFRIVDDEEHVHALGVSIDRGSLAWAERPAPMSLREFVEAIESAMGHALPPGYVAEVRMELPGFVDSVGSVLRSGIGVFIDYGLPRRELYASERSAGTLLCHYRHRAHADPFFYPGLQDITAWVDFTALANAAVAAGMRVDGYATQASFLIAAGIENEFLAAGGADTQARLTLSRQMQTLLMPGEMGEKFKVMWLGKGDAALGAGFESIDQRQRL